MRRGVWWLVITLFACSSDDHGSEQSPSESKTADSGTVRTDDLTFRSEVPPIRSSEQALPRVFIPPYRECRPPRAGERGSGPDGQVCTNVAISGATEEGKYFPDYARCDVVISQRPFWPAPPKRTAAADDPRLSDRPYLDDLAWVRDQIAASGCVCCHDSRALGGMASQWDIALGPLWLDSLSDSGLALFAGLADSSVLGAYAPEENNGFDRNVVGIPTTDNARMRRIMLAELARRGISEQAARAVPAFGGPIYDNRVAKPVACGAGEGVSADGSIRWTGGAARYVYVTDAASENPGVPPNLDLPKGTLFRLDVLASQPPIESGVKYGTTPSGTFQSFPEQTAASSLVEGKTYRLYVLKDVGIPLANCTFEFGRAIVSAPDAGAAARDGGGASVPDATAAADASSGAASACALAGGDARGFGAPCKDGVGHSDCSCEADYCAIQPGSTEGYCTKSGCTADRTICPEGWSCFDLSRFSPTLPAICSR